MVVLKEVNVQLRGDYAHANPDGTIDFNWESFTQADQSHLRNAGDYTAPFATVAEGVKAYVEQRLAKGEGA